MKRSTALGVVGASVLFVLVQACAAESTPADRPPVPAGATDGGSDADAAVQQPDPAGGRDDNAASCYAACQNTSFTCQTKGTATTTITTAELALDDRGCSGTMSIGSANPTENVALKIDCRSREICKGAAPEQPATTCVAGTYSAFSFAYANAAGGTTLCTRN